MSTTEETKSATTEEPTQEQYIPGDDEVTGTGGRQTWRFAKGKIVTGRGNAEAGETDGETGHAEERERITGIVRRVGIHSGQNRDTSVPYTQLEADVEQKGGAITRIKAPLTDRAGKASAGVQTLNFAEGLLAMKEGEVVCISAFLGNKPNAYGNFPTYVNVDPVVNGKVVRRQRVRTTGTLPPMLDQWNDMEPKIRAMSIYKDRESDPGESASNEQYMLVLQLCKEKGWEGPDVAPEKWLPALSNYFKAPVNYASVTEITEEQWDEFKALLAPVTNTPRFLAPPAASPV